MSEILACPGGSGVKSHAFVRDGERARVNFPIDECSYFYQSYDR